MESKIDEFKGLYIGPFRWKNIHEITKVNNLNKNKSKEANFEKIFLNLKNCVEEWGKKSNFKIEFTKAEYEKKDELIDNNVKKHIKANDFVIADISCDNNKNVLLELGYAEGNNKPYIIISQGKFKDQLPTNKFGRWILEEYNPDKFENCKDELEKHLFKVIDDVIEKRNADFFQVDCFNSRDIKMIHEQIMKSFKCIHILQTNLETINTNHVAKIREQMKNRKELRLRLLTLDPQCTYVNERAKQLGRVGGDIGVYRSLLNISLEEAKVQLRDFEDRLMIKIYDDFPTQMTYRFDNRLLVCTVSRITKSRLNCSFLIDDVQKKGVQQSFIDHFREIWNSDNTRTIFGNLPDDEFLNSARINT